MKTGPISCISHFLHFALADDDFEGLLLAFRRIFVFLQQVFELNLHFCAGAFFSLLIDVAVFTQDFGQLAGDLRQRLVAVKNPTPPSGWSAHRKTRHPSKKQKFQKLKKQKAKNKRNNKKQLDFKGGDYYIVS